MRAWASALFAIAIAGCGERSSIDIVDASTPYAYPTATTPPTMQPPPPPPPSPLSCSPVGAFGVPVPVPGLDVVDAAHPSLVEGSSFGGEETAVYFDAPFAGTRTIAYATRSSLGAPFGVASYMSSLGVGSGDAIEPRPTPDGLVFASNGGGSTFALYVRPGTTSTRLEPDGGAFDDVEPFFFEPGGSASELWFSSNRSGDYAIYRTVLSGDVAGTALLVTELDEPGVLDGSPVLTSDGLTIFFSSARDDVDGTHGVDIFEATRSTTSDPFGAASRVVEVSSPGTDTPGWISRDGCRLYFTSDRGGADRIWIAARAR